MSDTFGFSQSAANDVLDATDTVQDYLSRPSRGKVPQSVGAFNQKQTVWVHVTSTTLVNGYYPGSWTLRDPNAGTWTDKSSVYVEPPNGETLSVSRYYCERSGTYSDGTPIYEVIGSLSPIATASRGGFSASQASLTGSPYTIVWTSANYSRPTTGEYVLASSKCKHANLVNLGSDTKIVTATFGATFYIQAGTTATVLIDFGTVEHGVVANWYGQLNTAINADPFSGATANICYVGNYQDMGFTTETAANWTASIRYVAGGTLKVAASLVLTYR